MKRHIIIAVAIAFGMLVLGSSGIVRAQQANPNPMPMKNKMSMRHGMMATQQSQQAKPGMMQGTMMQGNMMNMMHKGGMMAMGDPLFKSLHGYGCPGFILRFANQLDLSQDQIQKLETLKLEFKKVAIQNQANRKVALLDLKEILNAKSPNFKKAQVKLNQITNLEGKLRTAFLNKIQQGRQVLTPDQLQKLKGLATSAKMPRCKGNMM